MWIYIYIFIMWIHILVCIFFKIMGSYRSTYCCCLVARLASSELLSILTSTLAGLPVSRQPCESDGPASWEWNWNQDPSYPAGRPHVGQNLCLGCQDRFLPLEKHPMTKIQYDYSNSPLAQCALVMPFNIIAQLSSVYQWLITCTCLNVIQITYRKLSNISRTLVGNKIVDHSDVVGASPVGATPTTSSFST